MNQAYFLILKLILKLWQVRAAPKSSSSWGHSESHSESHLKSQSEIYPNLELSLIEISLYFVKVSEDYNHKGKVERKFSCGSGQ